mmetsp:Transcript_108381/g.305627  ORF Transcript_108381/g.305627 Transcript_108381/m.305627 type:complete len:202 (+) Transcript_108381:881-1486(+)
MRCKCARSAQSTAPTASANDAELTSLSGCTLWRTSRSYKRLSLNFLAAEDRRAASSGAAARSGLMWASHSAEQSRSSVVVAPSLEAALAPSAMATAKAGNTTEAVTQRTDLRATPRTHMPPSSPPHWTSRGRLPWAHWPKNASAVHCSAWPPVLKTSRRPPSATCPTKAAAGSTLAQRKARRTAKSSQALRRASTVLPGRA